MLTIYFRGVKSQGGSSGWVEKRLVLLQACLTET